MQNDLKHCVSTFSQLHDQYSFFHLTLFKLNYVCHVLLLLYYYILYFETNKKHFKLRLVYIYIVITSFNTITDLITVNLNTYKFAGYKKRNDGDNRM